MNTLNKLNIICLLIMLPSTGFSKSWTVELVFPSATPAKQQQVAAITPRRASIGIPALLKPAIRAAQPDETQNVSQRTTREELIMDEPHPEPVEDIRTTDFELPFDEEAFDEQYAGDQSVPEPNWGKMAQNDAEEEDLSIITDDYEDEPITQQELWAAFEVNANDDLYELDSEYGDMYSDGSEIARK